MADHDVNTSFRPGVTLRSLAAMVVAMLVMGMMLQFAEVLVADAGAPGELPLPMHAMMVFLGILALVGCIAAVAKFRLLTRNELLCVLMAMLISAPMMTQGMWHRFLSLIGTLPRTAQFQTIDAYNDKLWPHGDNLIEHAWRGEDNPARLTAGTVAWESIEYEEGATATIPVLKNTAAGETSSISLIVPVAGTSEAPGVSAGEPYLVSFLAKPEGLSTKSSYYCRIYIDDQTTYKEVIQSSVASAETFLHRKGFLRVGTYNITFDAGATSHYRLEVGLTGPGQLALVDPKLFSVAALEGTFKGKKIVTESTYATLSQADRANLIVKPDNMVSLAGMKFLIAGYIPLRQWLTPAIAWSVPILLLLCGTLAVNVIMRRQWAENERYPFPLFQIPHLLMGGDDTSTPDEKPFAPMWKNGWTWTGIGIAMTFGLLKTWHAYDPSMPDVGAKFVLKDFLGDPSWGNMWAINFEVIAFFVGISLFFELNVLFSLVIGFFLFRLQYYIGEQSAWNVNPGYPFRYEQSVGGYLGYFFIVVFFTRKYLVNVLKQVFTGAGEERHGEVFAYRMAMATLVITTVGIAVWAGWMEIAKAPMLLFFSFLLVLGFVAAKFRAECGLPNGYFTPYNGMLFVSLLGGMKTFGAEAMMFCLIASGFLTVSVFFFIPGSQLEFMEFGRRYKLRMRHILITCMIGALGGLFIGGWVFLSNSYALGGDNIRYQWSYSNKLWFFRAYQAELQENTTAMLAEKKADVPAADGAAAEAAPAATPADERGFIEAIKPSTWAYLLGGFLAMVVAILRQFIAGFWFHPIGVILGSSHMLEWSWGSILFAGILRWIVLKLGGAATVKNKLMPLGAGLVIGSVLAFLVMNGISAYQYAHESTTTFGGLP